jgi:outer membrane protein OmpA-like peptidoglycan-associated protein
MIRAERWLPFAVATVAVPLLLLAGCAALGVDSAKVASTPLPSRPRLSGGSIEQLRYGKSAPFQVCAGNTCPKPTRKTLAGATPSSDADTTAMNTAPTMIAAPSLELPAALVQPDDNEVPVEPRPKTVMITFASGAAVLTPAARKTLDAAARDARAAATIEIRGRTDELGSAQLNDVLARNRAFAVRDYLRQSQLPEQTLIRVSFKGACCYIAGNDTAEGRAANRRVEIEFKRAPQLTARSNRDDRL